VGLVPVDLDGGLVLAHSAREKAAPTLGSAAASVTIRCGRSSTTPLSATGGCGEPPAAVRRTGSANAKDSNVHIAVLRTRVRIT